MQFYCGSACDDNVSEYAQVNVGGVCTCSNNGNIYNQCECDDGNADSTNCNNCQSGFSFCKNLNSCEKQCADINADYCNNCNSCLPGYYQCPDGCTAQCTDITKNPCSGCSSCKNGYSYPPYGPNTSTCYQSCSGTDSSGLGNFVMTSDSNCHLQCPLGSVPNNDGSFTSYVDAINCSFDEQVCNNVCMSKFIDFGALNTSSCTYDCDENFTLCTSRGIPLCVQCPIQQIYDASTCNCNCPGPRPAYGEYDDDCIIHYYNGFTRCASTNTCYVQYPCYNGQQLIDTPTTGCICSYI